MGRKKKTQEEFVKEVYDLVENEYSVLGTYKDYNQKIKMRHNCKNCNNYEWEITPGHFLHGSGCPMCARKKTTEEFKQEVSDLVGDEYSVIGEYIGARVKIKMRHNSENCNSYEWVIQPNSFLHGTRCPKCFGNPRKTTEEFKQEIYELVGDEYSVIGEYTGAQTKIKMKHNICGNIIPVSPNNFLSGKRCTNCKKMNSKTRT